MTLKRTLTTSDASWIVAGNMIGAGIFIMPGIVASYLPGAVWTLSAWLAGGLLALAGAMVYGELGSRYPRAGGDYQYLREAFGPLPAFVSGWAAFLLTFSAAAAAMSIAAVQHLAQAFPLLARIQGEYPGACGAVVVLLLTAANAAGARVASRTTLVLTALPLAALAWLFLVGLGGGGGRIALPAAPFAPPHGSWALAFGNALVPVFFTYSGWNAAAYLGGEMKDAPRSLPRSLLIGTAFVTGVYLLLNALLLTTLPIESLAGSTSAVADAARTLVGPGAERVLALGIALAILGSANVTLMAGARIYYAMACDGLGPAPLAKLNRAGVPGTALWAAGIWAALLAATAQFERLYAWSTLAILLLSALTVAGLFVLRGRAAAAGTFRCPGYPVTPVLYLLACLGVAASSCLYDPAGAISGMGLVLLGIPAFFVVRRFAGGGRQVQD
jgi:APA family basic amino acid/polyamine antiporter